jgi:hypothetical protein
LVPSCHSDDKVSVNSAGEVRQRHQASAWSLPDFSHDALDLGGVRHSRRNQLYPQRRGSILKWTKILARIGRRLWIEYDHGPGQTGRDLLEQLARSAPRRGDAKIPLHAELCGYPGMIVSDNGTELTSNAILA